MTNMLKALLACGVLACTGAFLYFGPTAFDNSPAQVSVDETTASDADNRSTAETLKEVETEPAAAPLSETEIREKIKALLPGDFGNFTLHDTPHTRNEKTFLNASGDEIDLSHFAGNVTLVNFWATWCPPCIAELPSMDRLQSELADEGLNVVAISLDRGGLKKAGGFWKKAGFKALGLYADPDKNLAQQMRVRGLPMTAILDAEGRELGRITGEAEWDSEEVKALMRFLIEVSGSTANRQKEASVSEQSRAG